MKRLFLACAASLVCLSAQAQTPAPQFRWVAGLGFTGGGDEIATAYYTDGKSTRLHAGGGVQFYLGGDWKVSEEVALQVNAGIHTDESDPASNGKLEFRRFPIELLGYYTPNAEWRIGGGARLITNAKLAGSGAAGGYDDKFDASVGAVLEAEYMTSKNFGIKFRAVKERYTLSGTSLKFKGDHLGLLANFYF
jgi:hypothetical protein